jgi:hypothetical protein
MTGYAATIYVLAWIYMWKPDSDIKDFQPGYFAILVLPALVFWAIGQVQQVRGNTKRKAESKAAERKVVSFD